MIDTDALTVPDMSMEMDTGVINIYKEKGYTSHDVVAIVRRTIGQALSQRCKAGHTGTLDPQAEGVLPVCVGKATRLASYLAEDGKTYIAEVLLGYTTDTGDRTGRVLTTAPVFFDEAAIEKAAAQFVGEYAQTPPMYSALKVNGKKLYELARQGVAVERKARTVQIRRLTITAYHRAQNTFTMEVDCSKGTYIRTLCADIGALLGCGACMGDLVRTRSGLFTVADSIRLADFKLMVERASVERQTANRLANQIADRTECRIESGANAYLWPPERVLPYPRVYVKADYIARAINGNPIPLAGVAGEDAHSLAPGDKRWLHDGEHLIGLFGISNAGVSGQSDPINRVAPAILKPEVMML